VITADSSAGLAWQKHGWQLGGNNEQRLDKELRMSIESTTGSPEDSRAHKDEDAG
jgi:hypothetical protein